MTISELDRRMYKLLRFCIEYSDQPNTVFVDEKGLYLHSDTDDKRAVTMSEFPYSLEQCRYYTEQLEKAGFIKSSYPWSDNFYYQFELTDAGHAFLSEFKWWKRQFSALTDNVITIIVSVVTALLVGWLSKIIGIDL